MSVRWCSSSTEAPRRSASSRWSKRSAPGSCTSASSASSSAGATGLVSSSRERSALANACLNVRPSAIASPTDFMWVVSPASAPGNFSNANRGHLTTQ